MNSMFKGILDIPYKMLKSFSFVLLHPFKMCLPEILKLHVWLTLYFYLTVLFWTITFYIILEIPLSEISSTYSNLIYKIHIFH